MFNKLVLSLVALLAVSPSVIAACASAWVAFGPGSEVDPAVGCGTSKTCDSGADFYSAVIYKKTSGSGSNYVIDFVRKRGTTCTDYYIEQDSYNVSVAAAIAWADPTGKGQSRDTFQGAQNNTGTTCYLYYPATRNLGFGVYESLNLSAIYVYTPDDGDRI